MPKVIQPNSSPLQRHIQKWKDCTECPLCEVRKKTVLCKGQIPCDILFVGEAPGASEDRMGIPFVGPAGHTLDSIISRAFEGLQVRIAYTNLVCCIPKEEMGSGKYGEPSKESIEACQERLIEFVRLAKPRAIVMVGQLAKKWIHGEAMFSPTGDGPCGWIKNGHWLEFMDIVHPAAILKADITKQELMARRAVVSLEELATRLGL